MQPVQPVHPHDPPTQEAAKKLGQRFAAMMGRDVEHIRIDMRDRRQGIIVHGSAAALHGGQGKCTCCPRRRRRTVDGDEVGA